MFTKNLVLLENFLKSRRQGTSPSTITFYKSLLIPFLQNHRLTPDGINHFLTHLSCGNATHSYYRAIRALCNWAWKMGYIKDNPITKVDPPKIAKKILPSLTLKQVNFLIEKSITARDRAIIAVFTESGLRLSELTNIEPQDIIWEHHIIRIVGKGNKEGYAPIGSSSERYLREWLGQYRHDGNIWGLNKWGIASMLRRLEVATGLPCNPHTFRRTFACLLRQAGLDSLTIKDLGRWESLDMVLRYTRSITFNESLKFYKAPLG